MQKATQALCNWLDDHLDRFRYVPGAGMDCFEHIKPLGEYILILYSFSRLGYKTTFPALHRWVTTKGHILQRMVDDFGGDIDWELVPGAITNNPVNASALFMFRALKAITGKATKWDSYIEPAFEKAGLSMETGNIGVLFAADICGLGNCHDRAVAALFEVIKSGNALLFSSLYLVTHYIFYATKMGLRPITIFAPREHTLKIFLQKALAISIEKENYDIAGELVMCMNWVGCPDNPEYEYGLKMLSDIISIHGYVPNISRRPPEKVDDFNRNYHPSLVALAAIGHSQIADKLIAI